MLWQLPMNILLGSSPDEINIFGDIGIGPCLNEYEIVMLMRTCTRFNNIFKQLISKRI